MKAAVVATTLALLALLPRSARACGSCRGPGGAGSALTAPYQRVGVSLVQSTRIGYGVTDARATYRPFGERSHDRVADLGLSAAARPVPFVELGAQSAVGHVDVGGPGFHSSRTSLGDLSLRSRFEILEEPPLELTGQARRPSLGLTLTARLPTGPVDRSTDGRGGGPSPGTVGSTATSQGLGTTELALAVDVRRSFANVWQVGAVVEGALRAPDDALGLDRALGPRGLARLMLVRFVGDTTLGVFADVAAEGDVAYRGRTSPRSAQRAVAFGVSATLKTDVGYRAGLALSVQPPVSTLSENAVVSSGLSFFVAWTR